MADGTLAQLEQHLVAGKDWGPDEIGLRLARAAADVLVSEADSPRRETSVVAAVIRSEPRSLVIVAQVKSPSDWSSADKRKVVAILRGRLSLGVLDTDEMAFGIRDARGTYGLVAHGAMGKGDWAVSTNHRSDSGPIERAAARVGAPPCASGHLGQPLRLPSGAEWTVLKVDDRGKTVKAASSTRPSKTMTAQGRFLFVHYRVNLGPHGRRPSSAPLLVDAAGRAVEALDETPLMLPETMDDVDDARYAGGVATFGAVYDTPSPAKDLRARLPVGEFVDTCVIDLGR